jgi:hypothetical protein
MGCFRRVETVARGGRGNVADEKNWVMTKAPKYKSLDRRKRWR